jgi:hypothetical protein
METNLMIDEPSYADLSPADLHAVDGGDCPISPWDRILDLLGSLIPDFTL